ncbi:MAG: COX15/CtaA family protein [gamma proteobacterium symbiont of Bathyaustriella thionipta]|nr:COX15/CtaA family protein [gamma proteobacterium symbiont of Bathyaustriella thionipta]
MSAKALLTYARFVLLFALMVIVLGAYVRLSDAGLGCPDWPGCYGNLVVPQSGADVQQAEASFPQRPLQADKAWKEMLHRYAAATLGLLILLLAIMTWRSPQPAARRNRGLVVGLLLLVMFQAMLGMWTVTLLVKPAIVTLHLLFGFTTAALLFWLSLRLSAQADVQGHSSRLYPLAWVVLLVVVMQVLLGGWTSTNYAALACNAFPGCYQGDGWPAMNFSEAFTLWRGLGVDYEFGVLDASARAAIHMTHRIGAVFVLLFTATLGGLMLRHCRRRQSRQMAAIMLFLLAVQLLLGMTNVLASLPLGIAVAHNGVAVLLLLSVIGSVFLLKRDLS